MQKTNMVLATGISTVQSYAEQSAKTMQTYINRVGGIDPVQKSVVRSQLQAEVKAKMDQAKEEGRQAIQDAISARDDAENDAAQSRAKDTGYVTRLNEKISTCRLLIGSRPAGETLADDTVNALKNLFSEYRNDDLAIAAIKAAIPVKYAFWIVPESTNGQIQKHLEVIGKLYSAVIDKAGVALPVMANQIGPNPLQSEIDVFHKYCIAQDAFFAKDDAGILNRIAKENPELWTAAGAYSMQMGCADRFEKRTL